MKLFKFKVHDLDVLLSLSFEFDLFSIYYVLFKFNYRSTV